MQVYSAVSKINFGRNIFDAHAHIGRWYENDDYPDKCYLKNYTPHDIFVHTNTLEEDKVQSVLISNLDCFSKNQKTGKYFKDEIQGNVVSLRANERYPNLLPLLSCEPNEGSPDNIRFLLDKYPDKFVGLKFHPSRSKLAPTDEKYKKYLKIAQAKKLPCVFHSAVKNRPESLQYSLPEMIYESAKNFKDVPIVMAHLGVGNHKRGMKVLLESIDNKDANLYCDLSWVDIDDKDKKTIIQLIKELKKRNALDKVLFGSDAPITAFERDKTLYKRTVDDIKTAIKNEFGKDADEILDMIFYKNAEKLFINKK